MQAHLRIISGLLALILIGGCSTTSASPAKTHVRTIDKVEAVTPATHVLIENLVGHVDISQGSSQLVVHAKVVAGADDADAAQALANTIKLDVSRSGNQLTVHVHYPTQQHDRYHYIPAKGGHGVSILGIHVGGVNSRSSLHYQGRTVQIYQGADKGVPLHVDLAIKLPAGIQATIKNHVGLMVARGLDNTLTLSNDDGDVHAQDLKGRLVVRTGDGDVHVKKLRGDMDVKTGDGDVLATDIQAKTLAISTGDGDVHASHVQGDLSARTGDGDIIIDNPQGSLDLQTDDGDVNLMHLKTVASARVQSGDGDINLRGDLSGLQNFNLDTGSGDIHLLTPTPPAVHLNIHADNIHVGWPNTTHVIKQANDYQGDVGAATGNGKILTGNGDVVLTH